MGNNQVTIRRESHDYHFPPNTGVIYLHASYGYSERESAILWVWLRRPSDDREEMWEKSMSQAEEMMRKSKVRHSMWLLLAFGNRVRAFRWEPSEASSVVKQGERPSENKKETENDKGTEAEKSSDKGVEVGDAEHESEKETKGPNTTLIKAKGKQKATSDPNTAILKTGQSPEIHRNLIPKLDGQTLNTTVKKDSEAIEAFLRNARVGVPLSRGLSWIEPGEFDFDQ
ncbi:MAG: hypothetical protein M1840_003631 [Geoglossum simile]|nr:MAG: hypothetical protein M1840_003631 [Geoglossum simile]